MYDYIKLESPVINMPVEVENFSLIPFECYGLTFVPDYRPNSLIPYRYKAEYKNMRITLRGNTLTIENSIHKMMHGNNYSEFSYADLLTAVDDLVLKFNLIPKYVEVKRFEFGLNIRTRMPAMHYIENALSYKKKGFDNMNTKTGQPYGKKKSLTQYFIKLYDKVAEVKAHDNVVLPGNLLRIEIMLRPKKAPFLSRLDDLIDPYIICAAYETLKELFKAVDFTPAYSTTLPKPRERELLYAGTNPAFWQSEKRINANTAKKKRKRYNNLISLHTTQSLFLEIEEAINDKLAEYMAIAA